MLTAILWEILLEYEGYSRMEYESWSAGETVIVSGCARIRCQKKRRIAFPLRLSNAKDTGGYILEKTAYDLLEMVIVRLGTGEYHGEESGRAYRALRALYMRRYPYREDFMKVVSEYIYFWK